MGLIGVRAGRGDVYAAAVVPHVVADLAARTEILRPALEDVGPGQRGAENRERGDRAEHDRDWPFAGGKQMHSDNL